MEVPWLGVKSKLQLQVHGTATAMPDLSHIFDLSHSLWQCQILNPLSEARDGTHILMDTSRIHFCCTTTGTLTFVFVLRHPHYIQLSLLSSQPPTTLSLFLSEVVKSFFFTSCTCMGGFMRSDV